MPRKYDKIGPEGAQHIRHLVADLGVKDTASFLQAGLDARLTGHHETYISRIANGHYYPDAGGPKTRGKRLRLPARALTELMREVNVTQNYLGKPVSIEKLAKKYRCDAGTLKLRVVNKVMDVIRRFWSMVDRAGGTMACHPWRGPLLQRENQPRELWPGRFAESAKKNHRPPRFAYQLNFGEIPPGRVLVHVAASDGRCAPHLCCNALHWRPAKPAGRKRRAIEVVKK